MNYKEHGQLWHFPVQHQYYLLLRHMGMFKNNEAFHFMASYALICLDLKDQT